MEQAIDKIRDEMVDNHDDAVIQALGEMLLEHLRQDPECDGQIVKGYDAGKRLKSVYQEIEKYAKDNHRSKNSFVVTPEKAMEIMIKHFGINSVSETRFVAPTVARTQAPSEDFDLRLEDLL